ncbi:NAD-dependent deacylase [Bacillus marinisedimentorum]|uniref:NAD-dependent deacylase n=1 Tax=Bacillus marinisedimentorum TaxID=1821260 RepID=UPI0007E03709|nr:NAD-dependent deacylase [Bacillus marinisedimentorum]
MLASLLKESNYTVVLTGAGMSTESGLPDFRSSSNGMWKDVNPLELATTEAIEHNREAFVSFYRSRMEQLEKYKPHEGYHILKKWADDGLVQSVITQNVDGFHAASGITDAAELHGSLRKCHCHSCGKEYPGYTFLEDDHLACSCGGFIRPSVVLFGEMLPEEAIVQAERETEKAELFIVLGSSLQVSPANFFPEMAKNNGAKLAIVNMEPTPLDPISDVIIKDRKIGDVLAEADRILNDG